MTRQEFLRLGALLLAGHGLPGLALNPAPAHTGLNVLVIGAGIAGLAAARTLRRHHAEVRILEALDDTRTVDAAMQTLRTLFGRNIPDPASAQITRWAQDPFARGSYSFNALGATPVLRDHLAAPLQSRLWFAGEAASREHFGTAHGAFLSGLRAARELIAQAPPS